MLNDGQNNGMSSGPPGGQSSSGWVDFWNRPNAIYANQRNLEAHFACLQNDLDAHLPAGGTVLDFGCGDALAAEAMAKRCRNVWLYDAAPAVRERLRERLSGHPGIRILDDDDLAALPTGSVDLVLAVSVLQYIPREKLEGVLHRWRHLIGARGHILIADVVEPDTPMLRDIASQLSMARRHGFLMAALMGLGRMALSDYRRIRREAGFSTYTPAELQARLSAAGLRSDRLPKNIGPTPHRHSFVARPHGEPTGAQPADDPSLKVQ
ncbi:cyclopropane fatty-acyl-phospholipid synthase-like methyltransferase [Azospirillum sp. OGB3]|uniref:class I SAM-dependent methyltransferase n=1 Tax=Azospirillum sp. OGB3 TaxID=2587012 RepID=UPI001605E05D|nr:class I SAM-dependent methyltransferase [Azospirillum sp. OGB3]MBB3264368.1 cyclopropane fatty-acyl-phospholipid synthase-like methyltransferase [Azospirillum sp. OGB3]